MAILVVHLGKNEIERKESSKLQGLPLAYELYKTYEALQPVVIVPPSERALRFPGSSFFSFVFLSPITEHVALVSSALSPGYSLFRLGYEALVITGRSRKLVSLMINAESAEIVSSEDLKGLSAEEAETAMKKNITDSVMSIGRAGENGVLFASMQCGGREIGGKGLGCIFGWKNLKTVVMPGFSRKDSIGRGKTEKRMLRRQERCRVSRRMRREGGGCFIDSALTLGSLPVLSYSLRFDPRAYFLDGKAALDAYGSFPDSCQDCFLACGRRTKDGEILPTWEECIMLGANLGFFSLDSVRRLAAAVHEEGLSSADTGAILAYLRSLPGTDYTLPVLKDKGIDEYLRIIHLIGENRGLGERLMHGVKVFPDAIATDDHLPLLTDLRGDKAGAVLALKGLYSELPAAWLLPHYPLSDKTGALMALYEGAYRLALISKGYSPMGALTEWWGLFPSFVFRFPFLLRLVALLFSAYGLNGTDLLKDGLKLLDIFSDGKKHAIPDHFCLNPESAYKDNTTLSPVKLLECYEREKRIAEMVLKSRREKSSSPSSENNAAVGPSDERGRDGEPGLQ